MKCEIRPEAEERARARAEARAWLERGQTLTREIQVLRQARQTALQACKCVTPRYGERTGRGSGEVHRFERYAAFAEGVERKVEELLAVQEEIFSAVEEVEDSALRALLVDRHINCRNWEAIAEAACYSVKHVSQRLYPRALDALAEVLERRKGGSAHG